jgi:peroxiredoxin (alkyl hydroperoxide reductase subunit C)
MTIGRPLITGIIVIVLLVPAIGAQESSLTANIFDPGRLKPIDSRLKVQTGDPAPDFELPAVSGRRIRLSQYRGQKNVVLSFVPAAWTPVCSGQWPGYNLVQGLFEKNDTVMLGITVDNVPTLHAWVREMGGLWFEVLSDFWPHGAVADAFGVLRTDGTAERALIFIDRQGIISNAMVFDINERPDLKLCVDEVEKLGRP